MNHNLNKNLTRTSYKKTRVKISKNAEQLQSSVDSMKMVESF